MLYPSLTAVEACAALASVGETFRPDEIRVERREERWAAYLPDQRLAWFAASERGRARLTKERRVLELLAARCSFQAPRVIAQSPDGTFDVRTLVPGAVEPWLIYQRACADRDLAAHIGASVGAILAEQHTRIFAGDVAGWLPRHPDWPESSAWIRERLPQVVHDPVLTADIGVVLARYQDVIVDEADRVLVHQDVGLHNLAVDPVSLEVRGIFDYESASWSDRHHDFRYLLFDVDRDEMLDAARAVYEPRTGRAISRDRVMLYNAASAITFLAYRAGTPPEDKSCGRTLEQDLRWTKWAIRRVLASAR